MGRTRRFSLGRPAGLLVALALIAVVALAGPRVAEGYGGLQWARFHARLANAPRGAEHARRAGHAAARVVDLAAPLPWAREAASLALDAAQSLGAKNAVSAAAVYAEVRGALDRAAASPVRGRGLEDVVSLARTLDDDARAKAAGTAQ